MVKTKLAHVILGLILIGSLTLAGCGRIQINVEEPTPGQVEPTVPVDPTDTPQEIAKATQTAEIVRETATSTASSLTLTPTLTSTPIPLTLTTEPSAQPPTPTMPTFANSLKGRVLFLDQDALYIMNADGSGKKMLGDNVKQYHLSPDRTKVALVVAHADAAEPVFDLYTINVDDMEPTAMGENINVKSFEVISPIQSSVDWSPDSARLAFAMRDGGVYIIDADGGNKVQLAEYGRNAIWSHDGQQIAYTQDRDLWIADGDGTNSHRLVKSVAHGYIPTPKGIWVEEWSPDGQWILYSDFDPPFEKSIWYYIVNIEGGEPIRAVGFPIYWSPDGKKIAFVDGGILWITRPDGSNAVKVAENVSPMHSDVIWSPEGTHIAWATVGEGEDWRVLQDVFVAQSNGSGRIKLVSEPFRWRGLGMEWSPNEQYLVLWEPEEGIYLARTDGGLNVKIHDTGDCPFWSKDGQVLFFGAQGGFYLATTDAQWNPTLVHKDWSFSYSDCQWIPDNYSAP